MTEAEWRTGSDPQSMLRQLRALRGRPSERRLQLFAAACGRHLWPALADDRSRAAVEAAEAFADGRLDEPGRARAAAAAQAARRDAVADRGDGPEYPIIAATLAGMAVGNWAVGSPDGVVAACSLIARDPRAYPAGRPAVWAACADLLRDLFGNPFREVSVDPAWLTDTVVAVARGVYDDRGFDRLPVLADALDDAGCDAADLLGHCRDRALTHVRGCWAVDLLLGLL